MDSFVNSLTTVDISWSGFESNLDIFFYFVGITNSTEAASRLDCEEVLLVSCQECMMLKNCDLNHGVFAAILSMHCALNSKIQFTFFIIFA